jgi:hypothetical protein
VSDELRVDDGVLTDAERRLAALGRDLGTGASSTRSAGDSALTGAGQFATDLDEGATTFMLSWEAVFGVLGDSATAVSRLAGHTLATVEAADTDLARLNRPR